MPVNINIKFKIATDVAYHGLSALASGTVTCSVDMWAGDRLVRSLWSRRGPFHDARSGMPSEDETTRRLVAEATAVLADALAKLLSQPDVDRSGSDG